MPEATPEAESNVSDSTTSPPQSSLESPSPATNPSSGGELESFSREDLVTMVKKQRQVSLRYKNRFTDIMEESKKLQTENEKLQRTLQESQDKSAKRISELKETQEVLNQSKAHMEELFRQQLEEKEEKIKVQDTQIKILKETMYQQTEKVSYSVFSISETLSVSLAWI